MCFKIIENFFMTIFTELKKRILILDGAMGTMIQKYKLSEADYRGKQFENHVVSLKGNNDILNLTQPIIIQKIHTQYLEAGADIIETNTFNANSISMRDYQMEKFVYEINVSAAQIAREVANQFSVQNSEKPRFVAGAVGPTGKTASLSPNVENPALRAVTFDELVEAYQLQIQGLIDGGVDILLVETIFDTLNAKAALFAAQTIFEKRNIEIPIMISATISDKSGRMLAGQTVEAFLHSVSHCNLLTVGLNCALGAEEMLPYVHELAAKSPFNICVYPNAGLPDGAGNYLETSDEMTKVIEKFLQNKWVNIVGTCCGTTPEFTKSLNEIAKKYSPREIPYLPRKTFLSGLESLLIDREKNFVNVGERTNINGSKKFANLIREKKYEEAISIARQQVENGAQILDVNLDDPMLDSKSEMTTFLNFLMSEPEISKVPIMIDSSNWDVIEAALKCIQGKSIVNSISLKEGEEMFKFRAKLIRKYGAIAMVMAFDEKGQATTFERKIEICERAYKILTQELHFLPENIVFDPNILTIATGIKEHNDFAVDYLRAVRWIKNHLLYSKVSGGVSNLSFAFRGNDAIREAMHSVFLYYSIEAGMDLGIVNAGNLPLYDEIPTELRDSLEDVIFNKKPEATENLISIIPKYSKITSDISKTQTISQTIEERLQNSLIFGITDFLEKDISEALQKYSPLEIIEKPLMTAMNLVGEKFGQGKMFLPQVIKSARVMKKTVEILQPFLEKEKSQISSSNGKILLATVKGDVHDIGKNIVSVILGCNNFEIIDLGVMVSVEEILKIAKNENVDIIGLSALISPSLDEIILVAKEMEKQHFKIPLLIGGATTSKIHTALKIAPHYSAPVIHVADASLCVGVVKKLLSKTEKNIFISQTQAEYKMFSEKHSQKISKKLVSLQEAREKKFKVNWENVDFQKPNLLGTQIFRYYSPQYFRHLIDWTYFFYEWNLTGKYPQIFENQAKGDVAKQLFLDAQKILDSDSDKNIFCPQIIHGIFPASSTENDDILIFDSSDKNKILSTFHFLRQQESKESEYFSLADFIAPKNLRKKDYLGFYASVCKISNFPQNDDYQQLMIKILANRLAEALSEFLCKSILQNSWKNEIFKRFAFGLPALPDHSEKDNLFSLLKVSQKIDLELTENFAMNPAAATCGMIISGKHTQYFSVGKISDEQIDNYSQRKNLSLDKTKKLLSNLID